MALTSTSGLSFVYERSTNNSGGIKFATISKKITDGSNNQFISPAPFPASHVFMTNGVMNITPPVGWSGPGYTDVWVDSFKTCYIKYNSTSALKTAKILSYKENWYDTNLHNPSNFRKYYHYNGYVSYNQPFDTYGLYWGNGEKSTCKKFMAALIQTSFQMTGRWCYGVKGTSAKDKYPAIQNPTNYSSAAQKELKWYIQTGTNTGTNFRLISTAAKNGTTAYLYNVWMSAEDTIRQTFPAYFWYSGSNCTNFGASTPITAIAECYATNS